MLQYNDQILGTWRTTAKAANAAATTLLSGAQRMLERQTETSRELLAEYADAARQIEAAADAQALLAIQGRLARLQLEKATSWWAALYAEVGIGQKELLRNVQATALGFAESLSLTLDRVARTPGAEPVMSAMKLVVDATRSSYRASTGASAETSAATQEPSRPSAKGGAGRQASG